MVRAGVTAGALRYRSGQAVALFVLSALAVAACAFGPLYERAVEQAQLRLTLENTPVFSRGVSATAASVNGDASAFGDFLPSGDLGRFYRPAVTSVQLGVRITADGKTVDSYLASRSGQCSHLQLTAGGCPSDPGQVAVSSSAAKALHLSVGDRVPLQVTLPNEKAARKAGTLTVAGLYRPFDADTDYWFGHEYSSAAGVSVSLQTGDYLADTMFAADGFVPWIATQLGQRYPKLAVDDLGDITEVDRALRVDSVRLDDMSTIRSGVAALMAAASRANAVSVQSTVIPVAPNVVSAVAAALDRVDRGRHDARQVIPAFAAELALLVLVVIGIVVVAAADQRRPELALARLRGRSAGRAARLLDGEFGVAVLLSVVPGFLLAWVGCELASRLWLSGAAGAELRWPVLAAAAAVVVAEVAIVAVVARRSARKPVGDMLRRVPQRTARLRLSAGEAALGVAAIAGIVVTTTGDKNNALAVITPGFIAVLAGVVLSRVLAFGAWAIGQRALWRGRISTGLAGLQIARRPSMRPVVILLCVAAALIVSAADQWRVSERNRSVRAGAEAGASVVLSVHAGSAAILQRGVAAADPTGRYATPVITQNPPNGPSVMAVEPASFGRIAAWGWSRDHATAAQLAGLTPRRPPPVVVKGTVLRLRLSDLELSREKSTSGIGSTRGPVSLRLDLRALDGKEADVRMGPLPEGKARSASFSATVPCAGGCRLSRISLIRTTADADQITIDTTIAGLDAGRPGALRPVSLRAASEWADASRGHNSMTIEAVGATLGLSINDTTGNSAVQHLDVPLAVRALLAGPVPDTRDEDGNLTENGLDGIAASFVPTGRLPVLPGAPGPALLVDLDTAALVATPALADSTAAVWLGKDDPSRERDLVASLARHGVTVTDRDTLAAHRSALAKSAPAWAMQLALVTALLSVLIAAIVMLLSAAAARRSWTYDVAALELAGVSRARLRRAALLEQVVVAVVGVAVGTVMGLIGARLALPSVPMFLDDVSTPAVLRPTAWASVGAAALLSLVVLAAVGVAVGLTLVRQVGPARVHGGRG